MSTQKLLLLLWNSFVILFSLSFKAQSNNDPVFAFDLRVKAEGHMAHDFHVAVAEWGGETDTVTFKRSQEVYITLKRNEVYTFTFTKKGYTSKVLIVNTALPDSAKTTDLFTLFVEVELFTEAKATEENKMKTVYAIYDTKLDDFALCSAHCD